MSVRVITTVVTPAGSYDLTSRTNVKAELSITDTASDSIIDRYITSASAAISQYCNRVFPVETVKDEFWPEREFYAYQIPGTVPSMQLTRWPTGTVTSITENGNILVGGTDFRIDPANGSLIRLDGMLYPTKWCAWPIVAIYAGGFAATPADVEDAAIRMVKARYLAKGRDPLLKQESIPGVREYQLWVATGSDAGNMPPDVADILDNYRVPVVA